MTAFVKFDLFVDAVAKKKHNLATDSLVVALVASANAPNPATFDTLSDLTQIAYTFCSSRAVTVVSAVTTAGVFELTANDLTLTATGGVVGPFRYVVLYNDTAANDDLIGYWDYGSDTSIPDGDSINLVFTDAGIVLSLE